MSTPYLSNAGVFLINTVFGLYIIAVMLRFLLGQTRADFYNPFSQFLVTITNPALKPLRRVIPGVGGVDLAALVLLLALQALETGLVFTMAGYGVSPQGLVVTAVAELLSQLINIYLFGIVVLVVLSWVAPQTHHPVASLLRSLTSPLLLPAQRLLPPIGGIDLSPVAVLVLLQLSSMLIVAPLRATGYGLM